MSGAAGRLLIALNGAGTTRQGLTWLSSFRSTGQLGQSRALNKGCCTVVDRGTPLGRHRTPHPEQQPLAAGLIPDATHGAFTLLLRAKKTVALRPPPLALRTTFGVARGTVCLKGLLLPCFVLVAAAFLSPVAWVAL